ncbi:hypothetical protein GGI42DRAFT_32342 [Trichoderma sp. SZMC 28013]
MGEKHNTYTYTTQGEWRETKIKREALHARVSPVASSVVSSAGLKRGCMMPAAHLRHGGYRNRTTSEDLRGSVFVRFVSSFAEGLLFSAVCVLVLCFTSLVLRNMANCLYRIHNAKFRPENFIRLLIFLFFFPITHNKKPRVHCWRKPGQGAARWLLLGVA